LNLLQYCPAPQPLSLVQGVVVHDGETPLQV
jgi:hypothetical protein